MLRPREVAAFTGFQCIPAAWSTVEMARAIHPAGCDADCSDAAGTRLVIRATFRKITQRKSVKTY